MNKNQLDISLLKDFFGDDTSPIKAYLNVVIEDWTSINAELKDAIKKQNLELYKDVAHKMALPISLLSLNDLQQKLKEGRAFVSNANDHRAYFDSLIADIENIIALMKLEMENH